MARHSPQHPQAAIIRTPKKELTTEPRPPIDHLSIPDVTRLIGEIKPRVAILSHFGLHVWQAGPRQIAAEMARQTGVRVIAARDGMKFDLAQLEERDDGH